VTYDGQALLRLLPELYEQSDGENGPLRALLDVLAGPAERVDENIRQLYDDQFIETCAEWVVPYIGDLLGVRSLHHIEAATFSQRGWVANALAARRRKGTLSMLRQLAQDVTGYRAAAVEMFQLLEWTQNLNHLRFQNPRTPDLRQSNPLELVGTAFMPASSTADVRSVRIPRGKYNIPNIGIFLWRLQHFPLEEVQARKAAPTGAYTFSPLGIDAPLFNSPEPEPGRLVTGPATEMTVPDVLRRRAVHDDLEAMRQADVLGATHASPYFDTDPPVFQIQIRGEAQPVPTDEIFVCNLETWGKVPTARTYRDADGNPTNRAIRVGVDPLRGRLRFVAGQEPANDVLVSYSYGFSSAFGGGPYDRTRYVDEMVPTEPNWYRCVQKAPAGAAPNVVATLQQAIADWNAQGTGKNGVIAILDNETYASGALTIEVTEASHLLIVGADWPLPELTTDPRDFRQISPTGVRPHVQADLKVRGVVGTDADRPGSLTLNGLLVEGSLTVLPGNLGRLDVSDTTLVPRADSLVVQTGAGENRNLRLRVRLERAILGQVRVLAPVAAFEAFDSIVNGDVAGADLSLNFERVTITGAVDCERIDASDTLFMGVLDSTRTQVGCVRFSFFPEGSRVPRAYRCQPDLAIEEADAEPPDRIRARMTPSFVSSEYGQPAYLQLAATCAPEILAGASNGAEMGAFNRELHTLREANLRFALTEFLRVGLEAGIFHSN